VLKQQLWELNIFTQVQALQQEILGNWFTQTQGCKFDAIDWAVTGEKLAAE